MRRVMDMLSLREYHARTLLIHYRWDVEKLFAVLVEKGRHHLFATSGVTMIENQSISSSEPSSMVMCDICMEEVHGNDATRVDCGHCFCNNCKHFFPLKFYLLIFSRAKQRILLLELCKSIFQWPCELIL